MQTTFPPHKGHAGFHFPRAEPAQRGFPCLVSSQFFTDLISCDRAKDLHLSLSSVPQTFLKYLLCTENWEAQGRAGVRISAIHLGEAIIGSMLSKWIDKPQKLCW